MSIILRVFSIMMVPSCSIIEVEKTRDKMKQIVRILKSIVRISSIFD